MSHRSKPWSVERRIAHAHACIKRTIKQRLCRYVVAPSGCWEWQGSLNKYGYGTIGIGSRITGGRKVVLAHRLSYETFVGPIPDGMNILHDCDNPACINPAHLYPGTDADNMADMIYRGRQVILRGSEIGSSILTEDVVKEIKSRLGYRNSSKLAREYGVSNSLIDSIRAGRSWRHVK